ncbi:DUF3040 domain-containing protein [Kutzneria albida]|uniref:Uncharacterized protein n=1 Tax=Kutzneria albida DSM 43870 TaxID=1449976 RepID=W5WIC5_9PSEU|nr:DUF3040 domain-containing protein [Kutzneria albida]AHH97914.1 hypothetical protein KALB_4552 [Kutzneria albida DSM 43870]
MLSQYERRQLEAIEQALTEEDPKLASALRRGVLHRYRWLILVSGVCGVCMLVLGIITGSATLGFAGFGIAVAGFGLYCWRAVCEWIKAS